MHKPHGNLGLDLVRALAILAVLFSHTTQWWLPQTRDSEILAAYIGSAGVEVFFSLSGFLIGGILLRAAQTGLDGQALLRFWTRRWFRTLPAYWIMLALLDWHFNTWDWHTPLFLQSFVPRADWTPLSIHTWSLVLEEWFYLFVPPLFAVALAASKRSRRAVPATCVALVLASALARLWVETDPAPFWGPEPATNPILRLDCAAWGVLAASWARNNPPSPRMARTLVAAGTAGLLLLGLVFVQSFTPERLIPYGYLIWGRVYLPFQPSLLEMSAACLVLGMKILLPRGSNPLTLLAATTARLSYALYLVHIPVLYLLRLAGFDDARTVAARALMAAAILVSAILMRLLVELPFLAIRDGLAPERTRQQPNAT